MSTTVAGHAFVAAHQRPSPFMRAATWVRDRWDAFWSSLGIAPMEELEPETYESGAGFPESAEAAEMRERPAADPAHVQTEPPSGRTVGMQVPAEPEPSRPEPPLVYMPPSPQDVLRNVAHAAMDMIGRDVDNQAAYDRLQVHMAELLKRARQTEHLLARSQSNVAESAMDAALLAAADRRGESPEELEERAARVQADIVARARRASDPAPTGTLPRITADMPDPRQARLPVHEVDVEAELAAAAPAEEPTVEIQPDHPWTVEDTGPETSESLSAICPVDEPVDVRKAVGA